MISKEEFHKKYDLFNVSIILEREIFPERNGNIFWVSLGITLLEGKGIIRICHIIGVSLDEAISRICKYLQEYGFSDIEYDDDHHNVIIPEEVIFNLTTIYRMKGMIE